MGEGAGLGITFFMIGPAIFSWNFIGMDILYSQILRVWEPEYVFVKNEVSAPPP